MYSLLTVTFACFLLSLLLTPVCRRAARRLGLVDRPDSDRKIHTQPIPRIGGVPIALSYLIGFAFLAASPLAAGHMVRQALPLAWRVLPAAGLVFLVGLLDDIVGLKPWQKLAGQLAAAGVACWGGVLVRRLAGHPLGPWAIPITILWLVLCANAFNLIDGVDGLASGVGLFATVTLFLAALLRHDIGMALATGALAGALLGFLRYNFNPASIFLGDSGSLLIGFLLGCYGAMWSNKAATLLGMTAPMMALSIPLLDTALAIVRRFLRREPIFGADRGHIHHRLLERGFTPRRVALLLYGFCGIAAILSLLQSVANNQYAGLILLLFCGVTWTGIQHLGYVEFGVARRMLLQGAFRQHLNAHIAIRKLEDSLRAAENPEACWHAVREGCRTFGFHEVEFRFAGRDYHAHLNGATPHETWTIRIPLPGSRDYIQLSRPFDSDAPSAIAPFAHVLRQSLKSKTVNHLPPASSSQVKPRITHPNTPGETLLRSASAVE